ncbi:uncharacterized protein LOC123316304 [Coccinella septempunctata]|uniref:uncharacterized protein LOC123316304 n=1 Tax=Coccinella septempunctata TaxID=41139 RepID=UPI001D07E118|nr:uncharacterized protein LOC123316304 [Coccinella septempunctata]
MLSLFLTVPLTLISIIGPVLNGLVIVAIILTRQISSVNHILLLHLGLLNIVLGLLFLIFCVPSFTVDNWISSGPFCTFYGFFFTLLHPLVVWTICGLNCDRYYAIASPLHYGHIVSKKKVFFGLSTGWIVSLALCVPPLLKIVPYGYIEGLTTCSSSHKYERGVLMYSAIYTIFTLLIPATLIICCNLKILMIARYHRHRIASAIYEVTLSAQVTITHQRNPFFVPTVTAPTSGGPPKFKGKSAIHAVFELLGSFLILYFPYYVLVVWQALAETFTRSREKIEIHPYLYPTATVLLISSIPVNGFLYGVKNKTLRKTFQNYLRKKQTKSEVNQEIQARTPSTCGSRRPSLTPLGFFSKPSLQRRLSEAFLDVQNTMSPHKSKIKRIASDIAWRPYSNSSLNLSTTEEIPEKMKQTLSCNTLQIPSDADPVSVITEDEISIKLKKNSTTRSSTAHLILQKIFTVGEQEISVKKAAVMKNVLDGTPKRSPRILITRAFSEESEKSNPNSPAKDNMSRNYSTSSTSLLEKKWRQMKYKYEESEFDDVKFNPTTKPLLHNSCSSGRESDSSDTSDTSSGKIFMSLDHRKTILEPEPTEEHLLLSWPLQKKYMKDDNRRKKILKQTIVNVTHEIVL